MSFTVEEIASMPEGASDKGISSIPNSGEIIDNKRLEEGLSTQPTELEAKLYLAARSTIKAI